MSITTILSNKETSPEEKLDRVAEIVASARKAYGNEDAKVEVPMINTTNGAMPFDVLEPESKVQLLRDEVARIKAAAVEFSAQHSGANINKKIEELISCNPMMTNIAPGTKFDYI